MKNSASPLLHRLLRRTAVSGAAAILSLVAVPLAAGADTTGAATINNVAVAGDQVTVSWTLNDSAATQVDVLLYDNTGALVEDDSLDPSVTSDVLTVDNGNGFYVVVETTDPSGTADSSASSPFNVFVDGAPTINTVSGTSGDITVTWSSNAPDATGYDVILYDVNGNVIADITAGAADTSATFSGVADGGGYSVAVVAHTPGGDLTSDSSDSFDVYQGAYIVDSAPVLDTVTCTSGDLTVTWTANAPDATGYDVILYDVNGNVIADITAGAADTSATFDGVADGGGYSVAVVAHTPGGDLTSDSSDSFDVYQGAYIVDSAPVITTVTGTADGGTVVVSWTANAADASGYDVIVYDENGNVIVDDVVSATATSDTIGSIPDGIGYTVVVVAHTPGGDYDSDPSAPFDFAGGTFSNDAPVTIVQQSCSGGTYVVNWSSNAADATGYDVILYDANGDVIADVVVPADALSATIPNVADGDGYTVAVVAHTPVGNLTATSNVFDVINGSLVEIVPFPVLEFGATAGSATPQALDDVQGATTEHRSVPQNEAVGTGTKVAVSATRAPLNSNASAWIALGAGVLALAAAGAVLALRRRRMGN